MPLTNIQKKELIRNQGLDPNSHYMDEASGDIFEGSDPNEITQPEVSNDTPPPPRPDTSSATKVFAKSFAQGVIPSAASIGAGALAAEALPFSHSFPPWSELGAGLIGGVAGGFVGDKVQSAVVPQVVQDNLFPSALESASHPIASQLGGIASAAPLMNPIKGVQSLVRGGGLVKDLITKPIAANAILTAAEKQGLKNLAVNAGVGVGSQLGIDTAQQLSGDEPFDYTRAGLSALGGLVLNEPTKISQKYLGMKPSFEGVPTRSEILNKREGLSSANKVNTSEEPYIPSELEKKSFGTEYNEPAYQVNPRTADDATIEQIFNREYPKLKGSSKVVGEGLVGNSEIKLTVEQKRELLKQQFDKSVDTSEDFQPLEVPSGNDVKITNGKIPAEPSFYQQQKTKGRPVEITERQEYDPFKPGPYKYSEESSAPQTTIQKAEIESAVDDILRKRGMTMGTYRKPIVDTSGREILGRNSGKPIAGNVDTGKREMNISEKGGPDTAYHEAGHQQLMDLATSSDAKDRELVSRVFAEHGKPEITSDEFLRLNNELEAATAKGDTTTADKIREQFLAAEEEIVQYAGLESSARKLENKGIVAKGKQYIKDYASRLGMGEKPATQQLSARQEYEAPYGTRDTETPRIETPNTNKESDTPSKYGSPQEDDYEKYLDVQRRISEKVKAGEFEGEDFKKLWQENEDIKNRNGGMPPKEKAVKKDIELQVNKPETTKEENKEVAPDNENNEDHTKQSEEPSKYKEEKDPNVLPKKPLFSFTTSVSDKIAEGKESSPIHKKVSSALRNYFLDSDKNAGKYGQSIARLYSKYSPKEVEAHYKDRWERDNDLKKGTSLTGKALELDNEFQKLIERPKIDAASEGLKVREGETYRTGGIKENGYLYNMFDPEVLHTIDNQPSSIEAKKSLRQWKDWLVKKGMKPNDAQEVMDNYLRARRDYGDTGGPEFGAMRKAEGMGLPWELIDKNPARAALRYGKRAGNDLAYFKNIQKDPELLSALGLKDQFGNNPEKTEGQESNYIGSEKNVQDALKYVWGKNVTSNPRFSALMRTAGNLVMGHGTAIRNIASIPSQLAPYDVRIKDIFNGISNLSSTRERAYETGATKVNTSEYEYLGDLGNPDPWVKNLDKMSDFLRKWQGRNMSDKFEGEVIYSIGEEWAKNMLATKNLDMLKRASGKSDYSIPSKPTQEDISDLAAGFTRLVRGSYGPTGLPNWALTGNVAPFVALNRYGIEKWNNVNKDVIQPLKNGNIKPFLSYTLASLGSGAMIEQINEVLSGKKGSDLNVQESLAAYAETQDPEILSQKVIGLMQMASYAGIVSDFAKMASRAAAGKEISYSNPVGMPLYTLATETFAENFGGMVGAIRDGENPIDAVGQFIKSFAVNTIQASRYAAGHLNKEETERKESFGDYRKYQEATGKSSREELKASKGNPYQDMNAKKFKKTADVKEASELVPELIQKAIKNSNGDPYKLKAEFRKLKSNNFQTMPSPETQPTEFYEYVGYLNKTIGPEKTALRVQKFFTQRAVNKIKNTMVP